MQLNISHWYYAKTIPVPLTKHCEQITDLYHIQTSLYVTNRHFSLLIWSIRTSLGNPACHRDMEHSVVKGQARRGSTGSRFEGGKEGRENAIHFHSSSSPTYFTPPLRLIWPSSSKFRSSVLTAPASLNTLLRTLSKFKPPSYPTSQITYLFIHTIYILQAIYQYYEDHHFVFPLNSADSLFHDIRLTLRFLSCEVTLHSVRWQHGYGWGVGHECGRTRFSTILRTLLKKPRKFTETLSHGSHCLGSR